MASTIYKAVPCKISRGVFSTERLFEVKKIKYTGFAPRHWCWNKEGHLLGKAEAADENAIDGFVAARVVEKMKGGKVRISIPNGELIEIDGSELVDRPTKVGTNVPVCSGTDESVEKRFADLYSIPVFDRLNVDRFAPGFDRRGEGMGFRTS